MHKNRRGRKIIWKRKRTTREDARKEEKEKERPNCFFLSAYDTATHKHSKAAVAAYTIPTTPCGTRRTERLLLLFVCFEDV